MCLIDHLDENTIDMDLEAVERDAALRSLLNMAVEADRLPEDMIDTTLEALIEREQLGSTGIGNGVAVPHARVDELDDTAVLFGHSETGVSFNALDGEPVHYIFLVVGPEGEEDLYAELMRRISSLARDDDFRHFLRQTRNTAQIRDLIEDMEGVGPTA